MAPTTVSQHLSGARVRAADARARPRVARRGGCRGRRAARAVAARGDKVALAHVLLGELHGVLGALGLDDLELDARAELAHGVLEALRGHADVAAGGEGGRRLPAAHERRRLAVAADGVHHHADFSDGHKHGKARHVFCKKAEPINYVSTRLT